MTGLNNQLIVRGGSPAVLAATTNNKPPKMSPLDGNKKAQESRCRPRSTVSACRRIYPLAANPIVSATEKQLPTPPDVMPGNQI